MRRAIMSWWRLSVAIFAFILAAATTTAGLPARDSFSSYKCDYDDFMAMLKAQVAVANATTMLYAKQLSALQLLDLPICSSRPGVEADSDAESDELLSPTFRSPEPDTEPDARRCLGSLASGADAGLARRLGCALADTSPLIIRLAGALSRLGTFRSCTYDTFMSTCTYTLPPSQTCKYVSLLANLPLAGTQMRLPNNADKTLYLLMKMNSTLISPRHVESLTRRNFDLQSILVKGEGLRMMYDISALPSSTSCIRTAMFVGKGAQERATWKSIRRNREFFSKQLKKGRAIERWLELGDFWDSVHSNIIDRISKKKKSRVNGRRVRV